MLGRAVPLLLLRGRKLWSLYRGRRLWMLVMGNDSIFVRALDCGVLLLRMDDVDNM